MYMMKEDPCLWNIVYSPFCLRSTIKLQMANPQLIYRIYDICVWNRTFC